MSTTATFSTPKKRSAEIDDAIQYRAIHTGAIFGGMLGLFSAVMLVVATSSPDVWMSVALIPVAGMSLSLWSLGRIRHDRDQFTGAPLAIVGFALSLIFLVAGVGYGGYIYATEVPEGYTRISFETLKPTELQERGGVRIPPEVMALNGKKVFIKGYIRPGSSPVRTGIDRFLLVRDNNQCCFGDLSKVKYYDQMAVHITSKDRVEDTLKILRMGGILEVHPENVNFATSGAPVFTLKADYAKQ
jgi:hypothetical protein